jgi:hypothetical protein
MNASKIVMYETSVIPQGHAPIVFMNCKYVF